MTTNHEGASGSGIALLELLGADTVDLGEIQIHSTVEQTTSCLISESIRGSWAILVSQAGQRFFNEMETRDKVSAAIIGLPKNMLALSLMNRCGQKTRLLKNIWHEDSPEALTEKLVMNPHALLAALKCYNSFVGNQCDEKFGRRTALRHLIDRGPFCAIRIASSVYHTMDGMVINTEATGTGQGKTGD